MEIGSRSYINTRTLQETHDREIAMGWYRAGDSVDCFRMGRLVLHLAGCRELGLI